LYIQGPIGALKEEIKQCRANSVIGKAIQVLREKGNPGPEGVSQFNS